MITTEWIKAAAANGPSYSRGYQYYRNGYVKKLQLLEDGLTLQARVRGGDLYAIALEINEKYQISGYSCNCPAFSSYYGACKHIVAAMLALKDEWSYYFPEDVFGEVMPLARTAPVKKTPAFLPSAQAFLRFFCNEATNISASTGKKQVTLLPTLFFVKGSQKRSWLEFTIGTDRMYVLKDISQLLVAVQSGKTISYGKNFVFDPRLMEFDLRSQVIIDLMQQVYTEDQQRADWSFSNAVSAVNARQLRLTNTILCKFLAAVGEQPFSANIAGNQETAIRVINGRPPVNIVVKAAEEGISLALNIDAIYGLDTACKYIYYKQYIYEVDGEFSRYIKPLLECFGETEGGKVFIPTAAATNFFTAALPSLETIGSVNVEPEVYNRFQREPLESRVYFDKSGEGMSARIEFHYGELIINPVKAVSDNETKINDQWLLREIAEEARLVTIFRRYGFSVENDSFVQADEEATYEFLQHGLPELQDMADIFYSDGFKSVAIKRPGKFAAGVKLNKDTDLLEFSLQFVEVSPQELWSLIGSYKLKKKYHRLADGSFIPLDSPDFQIAARLIDQLSLKPADLEKREIELPKYRALYLDSLARESNDFSMERNSSFRKMVQDVREPRDTEYVLPEGINGTLRGYQKTGFRWLKSLAEYGFGGILADDMGLGKTLQVLAFILSEKRNGQKPSIVIAPTSLVYNWQEEAAKFVPDLNVVVISGQQDERHELFRDIMAADLVVTSYGLIKRDIELYADKEFGYCFLDEAQHVKNPNTMNAKSVKKIRAKNYFALTGTPIENTLTELWSIFDFLMPGYLLSHKAFSKRFEAPIVKNKDQEAMVELSRYMNPFILRRMKREVLHELPEKVESKLSNEMTAEQSKVYAGWLLKARAEMEGEIQKNGFEKSQIKILSLLTRLRQICCHPSLFIENYQGGSGKLDMLEEIINDAIGGGHRILLFSQFTGMLGLIKDKLGELDIPYFYLDGATKAEERIRLVRAFNGGEMDIFLISLKAGGTGLNLTGADVVIHYDPWWNPAVEDQATDRAYRIGQKKSVQVYKLITKNTIEEKIYILQQKKKELIDNLIKPGENFISKMSESEIRGLFDLTF
ncbi:MAG: helicase associated domain protein [Firmicutes bacterium]|nr:helicase associated domain protein [Bacillota bacterium]